MCVDKEQSSAPILLLFVSGPSPQKNMASEWKAIKFKITRTSILLIMIKPDEVYLERQ